jgi:hypothetical protein
MTDDLTSLPSDSFANAMTLLAVAVDAKATAERLKALEAKEKQAAAQERAAEKAQAELAQAKAEQEAELAKSWAKLAAEEEAVANERAEVDAKYAGIDEAWRNIAAAKTRLVGQMMAFAGLTRHPLQSDPTVESLEPLLYGGSRDAHFSQASEGEFTADELEQPDHLVAGSSLSKSKPRRGVDRRVP